MLTLRHVRQLDLDLGQSHDVSRRTHARHKLRGYRFASVGTGHGKGTGQQIIVGLPTSVRLPRVRRRALRGVSPVSCKVRHLWANQKEDFLHLNTPTLILYFLKKKKY